jgi:polar amino acid transport system permease protein
MQGYNYTPYIVAGALFVLLAIPLVAVTDWVTLRAARRQSSDGNA